MMLLMLTACTGSIYAQDDVTNAFDDLQRKGIVREELSEMRHKATEADLRKLLNENPACGFFVFTEDRMNDIRLENAIPQKWVNRTDSDRNTFKGKAVPGEYYVWQIGVYAAYKDLKNVHIDFSSLTSEKGKKIPASSIESVNLSGIDTNGKAFQKKINVEKGKVQALWAGIDFPKDASGTYRGTATVHTDGGFSQKVNVEISVNGEAVDNHGDDQGWRKTRLRWLNSTLGNANEPTSPYIPVSVKKQTMSWLGGTISLNRAGLPSAITTCYDNNNRLDNTKSNAVLAQEMRLVIETANGEEILRPGSLHFTHKNNAEISWTGKQKNANFEVICSGTLGFDGISNIKMQVKSKKSQDVKDIRLEVPYTAYASRYMMGLGHKGGFRPDSLMTWQWDINKHQDKIWMGNINAGMNLRFMDENFVRPLVNIYYGLGKLNLPTSWGNNNHGGIHIYPTQEGATRLIAYSGKRTMKKDEVLNYNLDMQITPVKPIDFKKHVQTRFYHSNSDVSKNYIAEASAKGATAINIHHKKDIYPFINYPYHDEAIADLKNFVTDAHNKNLGVRLYYTTRELTVKIPELWALRSLGTEVIHDGPGKDARTLIHRNGPNEWLNKNLTTHFIPAWYNAFREGKFAGDMDISVITTPDSRWNNYYLAGLDWMINNLGIDGVYIDDSALDRKTIQRARRILDADGKGRQIDIHTWNHMNQWAGFANSLHLYTELLPYVDRTWIGEGFPASNKLDFWLVEMSGIPFGLMSETLDARNQFRGLVYGMLPRLPWSGNPVPLWHLYDQFNMENATMYGYWDEESPVRGDNPDMPVTVYTNGDKALVVIANWTDMPQKVKIKVDEEKLGFKPTTYTLPEVRNLQWKGSLRNLNQCEILGRSGMIVLLEK